MCGCDVAGYSAIEKTVDKVHKHRVVITAIAYKSNNMSEWVNFYWLTTHGISL